VNQRLSNPGKKKKNPQKFSIIKDPKADPIEERSKLQSRFLRNPPIEDDPDGKS